MSSRVQRVLVIQDASIELSVHAITWALRGLSLQPGDKIKLLQVVQLFRTANTLSYRGCGILGKNSSSFIIKAVHRAQGSANHFLLKQIKNVNK